MKSDPNRVAIVTGGSRGLGAGIVSRLLADDWRVAIADIIAPTELVSENASWISCDVSLEKDVNHFFAETMTRYGRVDALINNAGIGGPSDTIANCSSQDFSRVLAVNLLGAFQMAKLAIPHLVAAAPGSSIVNIGSMFGAQGVARGGPYCASKGGVALLTHTLALELAPYGIRVNTVSPGNMLTMMHLEDIGFRANEMGVPADQMEDQIRESVPLRRHGTGKDMGDVVAWLLSDQASYVTGQNIPVNGGALLS